MYEREHPPALGAQHPWQSPFEPPDMLDPRPDQDFAIAGPLAPQPQEFPFTDQGRREYYDAVRAAAQQQLFQERQHMHHMHLANAASERQAVEGATREREAALLLLLS